MALELRATAQTVGQRWAAAFSGCPASLPFCLCQDDACMVLVCDICPVEGGMGQGLFLDINPESLLGPISLRQARV